MPGREISPHPDTVGASDLQERERRTSAGDQCREQTTVEKSEIEAARARQERLATQVELTPMPEQVRWLAAMDVAYGVDGDGDAYGAVVLVDRHSGAVVERSWWVGPPDHDYLPGLFALREAGPLRRALAGLEQAPDLLLIDGHGTAHPRRFGLACLLGVELGLPSIGCAKRRLTGEHGEPAQQAGSLAPLRLEGETVGYVVRTQDGINPVFVSPGHRCTARQAAALIVEVRGEYRIPEPLRQAHQLSVQLRAGEVG